MKIIHLLLLSSPLVLADVNISLEDQDEINDVYRLDREEERVQEEPSSLDIKTQTSAAIDYDEFETQEEYSLQERSFSKFGVGLLFGSFSNPSEDSSTAVGFRLDMMTDVSALGVDFKTWKYSDEKNGVVNNQLRFIELKPWAHYYKSKGATESFFVPYIGLAPSFNLVTSQTVDKKKSFNRLGIHAMAGIRSTINESIRIFGEAEYAYLKEVNGFNASLGALYLF